MNRFLRRVAVHLGIWCCGLVTWLAEPAVALAQAGRQQPQGPQPHSDAIPYLLVLFCVVLGLIVLCRSAGRTTEVTLDELDKD